MSDILVIDGDYSEGGGQILRTSVALSLICRRPIRIVNIRKRRPKPGLRPQHLAVLEALVKISKAKASGLSLDSDIVEFHPRDFEKSEASLEIDTKTAGSIGLILQPLLLIAAFLTKGLSLRIFGGTSGLGAMPVQYYKDVIFPSLRRIGLKASLEIIGYGFYPKGGGEVSVDIEGLKNTRPLEREVQGTLRNIHGLSVASEELAKTEVAQRQAKACEDSLKSKFNCPIKIESTYVDTLSKGSTISIFAYTSTGVCLGADARGEKGRLVEGLGRDAARDLEGEIASGATVDRYLADNLIPWLALLGGKFKTSELTDHTRTNIWVCEQFFGKIFRVEGNEISVEEGQIKRNL